MVGAAMRMRFVALVIAALWACTSNASADNPWEGPGMVSCSQYAQEVRSQGESMRSFFFSWAEGFMSGLNTHLGSPANLGAMDTNAQYAFIDQYCDQQPQSSYSHAVMSLYDKIRTQQGLHDWRPQPKY